MEVPILTNGCHQPAVDSHTHSKPDERVDLPHHSSSEVELAAGLFVGVVDEARGEDEGEDHDEEVEDQECHQRAPVQVHSRHQSVAHAGCEPISQHGEGVAGPHVAREGRGRVHQVGGELTTHSFNSLRYYRKVKKKCQSSGK